MQAAAHPANEAERLAALRALLILDTPPELRFERIVQFAASEFEMPMAVISLVDADRQWFKARVGMNVCGTARDISFCAHALHAADLLIINDALQDPRFADNPLVTAEPRVRFYAGAPLQLPGGEVLGTLCVLDTRPRRLDAIEMAILRSLRDLVLGEITSSTLSHVRMPVGGEDAGVGAAAASSSADGLQAAAHITSQLTSQATAQVTSLHAAQDTARDTTHDATHDTKHDAAQVTVQGAVQVTAQGAAQVSAMEPAHNTAFDTYSAALSAGPATGTVPGSTGAAA